MKHLHVNIRRRADLVDQGLVRIGGQRDRPRRTAELALSDHGLIGVQQLDGGDVLRGALGHGDGHLVVRFGSFILADQVLFRADGEGDGLIQLHAAGLTRGGPRRIITGPNDIRILGNGELQHGISKLAGVRTGGQGDRNFTALSRYRGAGDGQFHILQHAGGAGIVGIDFKDRLCGDVLAGGRHGEGGNVDNILRNLVCHILVIGILDLPAFQHIAFAGCGGQGDGLSLVDHRDVCGGVAAHRDGSTAHGGGAGFDGHTGESTLMEVGHDSHFLAAHTKVRPCRIAESPFGTVVTN